jgi:hypothetical protein
MKPMSKFTRWHGQVNVENIEAFKAALQSMSSAQLSFYANALKLALGAPNEATRLAVFAEAHKLVLEEIARRVVLAYVEEGLGG